MVEAFEAALRAVDPYEAVRRNIRYSDGVVIVAGEAMGSFRPEDIVVLAIGKASVGMADAAVETTGATRGLVVTPYPGECALPVVRGAHPIPDATSLAAGRAMSGFAASIRPSDCVLALISGGGSAALELPVDDVGLEDLATMNRVLVTSGAPIQEVNEVRAAASTVKAGGLRRMIDTSHMATLVLSDVPGGDAGIVSSGPTVVSDLGKDAHDVVLRWGLTERLPPTVVNATMAARHRANGFPGDRVVEVASPGAAAEGAGVHLRAAGFEVDVLEAPIGGDVERAVGDMLGASRSVTVVAAGEASVGASGTGSGGRNQHAALLAAVAIGDTARRFGAFATDGVDGQTRAAGAVVDGTTVARARAAGYDAEVSVANFDSHPLLVATDDVVVTGPTGTNVADLWIATPSRSEW